MTRELIISANVHEKKVAILEDGLVTEFYVERGDENQGVVGNLYKGRVMKVLPGMQSAFVDIGLERDAFLYVSDFAELMEEEDVSDVREQTEEPQRDRGRAPAFDRGFGNRTGRPGQGSFPTPSREAPRADDKRMIPIQDAVEQLAEIVNESVIPPPAGEEEIEAELARGPDYEPAPPADASTEFIGEGFETTALVEPEFVPAEPLAAEDISAPEEEADAAEVVPVKGRPRRAPRARAAPTRRGGRRRTGPPLREEAEVESAPEGEQLDLAPEFDSQFERVVDEDASQDAGEMLKDALVQERIIERTQSSEFQVTSAPPLPEPEVRVGSVRARFTADPSFHRVSDADEEVHGAAENASAKPSESMSSFDQGSASDYAGESEQSAEQSKDTGSVSPFRHISDFIQKRFLPRGADDKFASETRESEAASSDDIHPSHTVHQEINDSAETKSVDQEGGDADASVRERPPRAEFAARRGGRGRRRRREPPPPAEDDKAQAESVQEGEPAIPDEVQFEAAASEAEVEAAPAAAAPPPASLPNRRPPARRTPPPRRNEFVGQRTARRPERVPATISELLHEGQEILVQIAKEPIAKKGARITSHIALPGRYMVYMPTVNHVGVSRKIASEAERIRLKRIVAGQREREGASGGFIARTACEGHTEEELIDDMSYLLRTWGDIKKKTDQAKAPSLTHRDLDLVQRILRDHLSDDFSAIRIDNELEYARLVEFVNRINPKLVKRVKLYTASQPILEKYGVQAEIDKAVKPRVWLKSGGYIVINQTEALVAIDVNTGKFVGKSDRLEDTITRTNLDAVKEIVRQIRLRDLGGIIVLDLIDMEERKNRQRVMMALQQELQADRAPSKILAINDFGLVAITRKRVKQSLERTLCTPCPYCQGAGMVKSPQTMCFEILEQAKAMSRQMQGASDVTLRVAPDVAEAFRARESEVLDEIEAYFNCSVTIEADPAIHREQFDFALS